MLTVKTIELHAAKNNWYFCSTLYGSKTLKIKDWKWMDKIHNKCLSRSKKKTIQKKLEDVGRISQAMSIVGNVTFQPSISNYGFRDKQLKASLFLINSLKKHT